MAGEAKGALLARVVADIAASGLGDRSLRDIAASVGTSHRMLLYHFGSRPGLVAAVVGAMEAQQRADLAELAAAAKDAPSLVLALWERVSAPEVLPFVRLFFETVGTVDPGSLELTAPWLDDAAEAARTVGLDVDPIDLRLGVAVTRGLLVDVLASGDVGAATAALVRFVALWHLDLASREVRGG